MSIAAEICKEKEIKFELKDEGNFVSAVFYGKIENKSSEKSSEKIVALMKENNRITIAELSNKLGITTRAIEKQIAQLKKAGKIKRIGSAKGGHWKVVE